MEQRVAQFFSRYLKDVYFPDVKITDILEILILTFLIYHIMLWLKNTKAWMLMKGIVVLAGFILIAAILQMDTILWIAKNSVTVLATALVVVFQPELRRALEKLGEKRFLSSVVPFDTNKENGRFSEATIEGIVKASFAMSKVKTGALIVVERNSKLGDYIKTGVELDAMMSCELLGNLFFNRSPLHDGAVIIRNGKICAAGCILPSSKSSDIPKELGTRHRAAVGISEQSDAVVLVVSEETGTVSIANNGVLKRGYNSGTLKDDLFLLLSGNTEQDNRHILDDFSKRKGQ